MAKNKFEIRYKRPHDFFNKLGYDLDKILAMPHEKQTNAMIEIYSFKEYPINHIRIYKYIGPPTEDYMFLNRHPDLDIAMEAGCYNLALNIVESKEDNPVIMHMEHQEVAQDFLRELYKYDEKYALELFGKYQEYVMENALEVDTLCDIFKVQTSGMYEYLFKNAKVQIYDIDYNKKVSDEMAHLIYEDIEKTKLELQSFNDSDYHPFIYDGKYVIRDVSSDSLLVCDYKDKDNFTWYVFEPKYQKGIPDNMSEVYYETFGMIGYSLKDELKEINKVLQYKDGEMVAMSGGVSFLHLLQNYIYGELVSEGKIAVQQIELSVERLLRNYAVQNEPWKIVERALGDFLNDLIYVDGVLTYDEFLFIKDEVVDELILAEGGSVHFNEHLDIEIPKNIKVEHLLEIKEYVAKMVKKNASFKGVDEYSAYYNKIIDVAILENGVNNKKTNKLK